MERDFKKGLQNEGSVFPKEAQISREGRISVKPRGQKLVIGRPKKLE